MMNHILQKIHIKFWHCIIIGSSRDSRYFQYRLSQLQSACSMWHDVMIFKVCQLSALTEILINAMRIITDYAIFVVVLKNQHF